MHESNNLEHARNIILLGALIAFLIGLVVQTCEAICKCTDKKTTLPPRNEYHGCRHKRSWDRSIKVQFTTYDLSNLAHSTMMATKLRLKNVEIVLENDRKVFQFGERVHGKLVINFTGELPLSTLQIGIVCMSKIKHADDTFDQKKLLESFYALPKSVASQVLKSGIHEIPFRFPLPDSGESPPTFDGRYGCINYFVECLIEEDGELHRNGIEIKLEDPVKRNLLLSVSGSSEKDLGLFCIGSGSVTIEATITRKGHLPGEKIPIRVRIQNFTTLKVQPRATLYQTQIFMSGDRHRTLELVLGESQYGNEVDPDEVTEDLLEVTVPPLSPLTMKSPIITNKYFCHVTLDIPHNIDLHINLPVVITNKCALQAAEECPDPEPLPAHIDRSTEGGSFKKIRKIRAKRLSLGSKDHSTGSSNVDSD